ncbi:MAG: 7-cyano-7-deazaguanine synthase [Tannerella sp.]|jgi:tRNA(Ile)-lysidine synthase TilS/MesJ|nr:7-cyano-7-deazaguanine synthase [Tannerella sp.]
MKVCRKCILTDAYPGVTFDREDTCSMCASNHVFEPYGEDRLMQILEAKKAGKRGEYDALVPLSGGKDSMYILYLAIKVYKLNVLTMTYDNGFVSRLAVENMERAVKKMGVKHIVCKPDAEALARIYRNMLLRSGDFCGACGIAIRANIFKVAREYKIPVILLGTSPLEQDSFLPDTTQDVGRFKYIMKEAGGISRKEMKDFLIYPSMSYIRLSLGKRTGKYAKEVCPLFYIKNPSDREMGEIIVRELGWEEDRSREYSKHFDCIAEPFTNYVRHHIYGYERRVCQYSTMVRRGEITREKALALYESDRTGKKPANYQQILDLLKIDEKDMEEILRIKPLKYESKVSFENRLFIKLMKLIKR